MIAPWDVVVVGAGPGGLAAAATAAESGMRVCLVDDNLAPGGQIWRTGTGARHTHPAAQRWLLRVERAKVTTRFGARVVSSPAPGILRLDDSSHPGDLAYAQLILAPGARELFLPFPGWTLPGVYGAGGLQAFVKSGLSVAGKRIVIAGTGPLLLAVAAALRAEGARILALVEQAPARKLAQFSRALIVHPGKILEATRYALRTAGIPLHFSAWVARVEGNGKLESVIVCSRSREFRLDADMLATGYHLIPNTELPQLLGCCLRASFVQVDALQRTSVKNIFCVGEATSIGGVDKALLEGRIAALAAAGQIQRAQTLFPARDRQQRFAQRLGATFALRDELRSLPQNDTPLCRCEDVDYGAVAACRSWREAKLHTRCGMGPCQGRICAPATQFLFGWTPPAPRPPLFPIELSTLAETRSDVSIGVEAQS
jgi:NADPH-dependent 2,4-dienoyl-CoA reductase/sulfur reductase-like enzyme